MTTPSHYIHQRRDRAESFGAVAADYDRFRPSYPDELIDDLVALADGGPVLDIGTGTGKAARLLAARGLDVLGVEPDPLMAEVARGRGSAVETGHFETWPDAGRTFALITVAQAWHWVDPVPGVPKAQRLLRRGGSFVPFWNFERLAADEQAAVSEVYQRLEPALDQEYGSRSQRTDESPYLGDIQFNGSFESLASRTYTWSAAHTVEDWLGRVATHSDHLTLPGDRLAALLAALGDALTALGHDVHTTGGTYLIHGKVPS